MTWREQLAEAVRECSREAECLLAELAGHARDPVITALDTAARRARLVRQTLEPPSPEKRDPEDGAARLARVR